MQKDAAYLCMSELVLVAYVQENDPKLRRLKEIERLARDRFLRLRLPGTFGGHAEVINAAEALWREAAAAVRSYSAK